MEKANVDENVDKKSPSDKNKTLSPLEKYCENFRAWKYQNDLCAWHVDHFNRLIIQSKNQSTNPAQASQPTLYENSALSQAAIKLPTLKRRVFAEIIDAFILAFIKFLVVWCLTSSTDLLYPDFAVNLLFDLDGEEIFEYSGNQLSQMMLFAFVYRFFTWFYEFYGVYAFGCTVGKKLLGIRVVQCTSITRNNNNSITIVLANRGGKVSWKYSFVRSALKNISIALLIPSSFSAFFNAYNRTSYDVASNTIAIRI